MRSTTKTVTAQSAYALTVTSVALLSLSLPTAASAFTIGQTSSTGNATATRGQSFIPSNIGPNGSGTAPSNGTVPLQSVTFAYIDAASRTASTLYLYNSVPTFANLTAGVGALLNSDGFSDSIDPDSRFGAFPSRTFFFTGANLDVNTTYYALFSQTQGIRFVNPGSYSGGSRYTGSTSLLAASTDTAFIADFTPTPVPFVFSPLLGLGGVGLAQVRKTLSKRCRHQQKT
ncbi:hypothetical protein [Myxacorys almedinensis]|uniref:Uncharacterized protein n=1 Tax=Myxacorys almedinensis A TaxID=2690445 RepID=A0A8J8CI81_9CYAN|nr:hypothetical protein [Myxacorys almedinensis]NDJ16206.1 hypothetical protein [Myxacorys almedinensis A]